MRSFMRKLLPCVTDALSFMTAERNTHASRFHGMACISVRHHNNALDFKREYESPTQHKETTEHVRED